MSEIIPTIRRLFASFRHSMSGLFDSHSSADDLIALIWLAMIGLVIVVVLWILKAIDNRRPMR